MDTPTQTSHCPFVPAHVGQQEGRYEWNAWDPYSILPPVDDARVEALSQLSDRAQIAYAIGCAEWVVQGLARHLTTNLPFLYLEAFWAFEMDKRIQSPPETVEADWQGRVLAPIDLALMTVLNTYYASGEGSGAAESALSGCIALHVLDEKADFQAWSKAVISQLSRHFPRRESDPWGAPISREALIPGVTMTDTERMESVQRFLASINQAKNPLVVYTDHDNSQP